MSPMGYMFHSQAPLTAEKETNRHRALNQSLPLDNEKDTSDSQGYLTASVPIGSDINATPR